MKEPYVEGVATHDDPEPCAGARKDDCEASVGARAGRVLSREIRQVGGVDAVVPCGRPHASHRQARCDAAPRGRRPLARAESSCARTGRSSGCPTPMAAAGRIGKAVAVRR